MHQEVESEPIKKPKKHDDSAVALLKNSRQLGFVFEDMEPPNLNSISRKSNPQSEVLKGHDAAHQSSGEQRSIAWCDSVHQSLTSAVRTLQNLMIGLRKRRDDKSDARAETRGDWREKF